MNVSEEERQLKALVEALRGQEIWEMYASELTGSSFSLAMGGRVEIPGAKAKGLRVTEKGEFGLYVMCSWRLEEDNRIIATSEDDRSDDGPMLAGLQKLVAGRVENGELGVHGWDLVLSLDNGIRLAVFSDFSEHSEWDFCYYVSHGDAGVSVLSGGALEIEPVGQSRRGEQK